MKNCACLTLLVFTLTPAVVAETASPSPNGRPLEPMPPPSGFTETELTLEGRPQSIWQDEVGAGFRRGLWHAGFSLGGSIGMQLFGGSQDHDLVLATMHGGRMISGVRGEGHWYRGNWDLVGEVFGARQINPEEGYAGGFTLIPRYHFATGTRWIPFVEAGAGILGTTISAPDLAGGFQFHLLAGSGLQWFYRNDVAINFEYRLGHISDAGTRSPNLGLNTNEFILGLTWFF